MSASTHSQALGTASETAAPASVPPQGNEHAPKHQQTGPASALAIEVMHGRMGCAVFLDEEQQLLLCEDLPCDFAFNDGELLPAAREAAVPNDDDDIEPEGTADVAVDDVPAYGHPSYGIIGSCEYGSHTCCFLRVLLLTLIDVSPRALQC